MGRGAIIRTASIAERHPAAPADTALRITVIIAILPVRGASTAIPSTAEARLVPAAAHQPMTTPITAIPMVRGCRTAKRSISAPRRARPAVILVTSMPTMWILTATANAMTAGPLFR